MKDKKIKKILTNFAVLIISLVLIIAILEIVLSVGSYFFYPRLSVSDETFGWRYVHTPKKVKRHFADLVYEIYINKDGFRDDEFIIGRDRYRIMVLGDSMTFGAKVDQEEIFCSLLEKRIKQTHPNKKIDVMNFGVPGFRTGQELICLKKYADIYPPDIVILILFEGNDFDENVFVISDGRYVPHFIMRNGKLLLCNTPDKLQKVLGFLRDRSVLFYILQKKLRIIRHITYRERTGGKRERVPLMCKILDEMHSYTESRGIPFFIFYIKSKGPYEQKFKAIKQHCMDKNMFFRPIPFVYDERIPVDWHWNSKGHNSVAEIIYDELSKRKVFNFQQY